MHLLRTLKKMRIMLPSILMILAAGWFTACSQDEDTQAGVLDTPSTPTETPISFGGAMDDDKEQNVGGAKQRTRAQGNLEDKHKSFALWGYKNMSATESAGTMTGYTYSDHVQVFGGYNIAWQASTANTTTDNTNDWSYVGGTSVNGVQQTIKYWDYSAAAYRFMAYSPADAQVTAQEFTDGTDTFMGLTFEADATDAATEAATPYVSKLWFSNNRYPDYVEYGKPVTMAFIHSFSKVRFMFIGEKGQVFQATDATVLMTQPGSIKFRPVADDGKIARKGNVTVAYPLTGYHITPSYTFSPDTDGTLQELTEPYEDWKGDAAKYKAYATTEKYWYTLLPNTSQGAFRMEITVNSTRRTAVVPAEYMQWNAGYRYTYVFKITPEDMTFQPQLFTYTKWQAGYSGTTTW